MQISLLEEPLIMQEVINMENIPTLSSMLPKYGAREIKPELGVIQTGINLAQEERQYRDLSRMRAANELVRQNQEKRAEEKWEIEKNEKLKSINANEALMAAEPLLYNKLAEYDGIIETTNDAQAFVQEHFKDSSPAVRAKLANMALNESKAIKNARIDELSTAYSASIGGKGQYIDNAYSDGLVLPTDTIKIGDDLLDNSKNLTQYSENLNQKLSDLDDTISKARKLKDAGLLSRALEAKEAFKDELVGVNELRNQDIFYKTQIKEVKSLVNSNTPLEGAITDLEEVAKMQVKMELAKDYLIKGGNANTLDSYIENVLKKPYKKVLNTGDEGEDLLGGDKYESYEERLVNDKMSVLKKQYQDMLKERAETEAANTVKKEVEKPKGLIVETQEERIEREKKALSKISPTVASLDKSILGEDYDVGGKLSKIKASSSEYSNKKQTESLERQRQSDIKSKNKVISSIEKSMKLMENEKSSVSEYKSKSESDIINNLPKLGDDIEKIKPKLAEIYQEMRGDYRASADIITQYFEENPDMTEEELMGKFILGNRSLMVKNAIKRKNAIEENIKKLESYLK